MHCLLGGSPAAAAKSLQSCLTLCDPIDSSPPGSPVPGILQARTLQWVAISFSSAWKWKVKVKSLSRVRLSATPWTTAYQAPQSMGFSRQEHWSGCHCLLQLGGSMMGLMATSSKMAYAACCVTQVCCSQSPCPLGRPLLTRASAGDTQTLKGSSGSVSVGSLGPGAHKVCLSLPSISGRYGVSF